MKQGMLGKTLASAKVRIGWYFRGRSDPSDLFPTLSGTMPSYFPLPVKATPFGSG